MNSCNILFFATLKERAGVRQITLDLPNDVSVAELRIILKDQFPALSTVIPNAIIAVNREYALDKSKIPPNAEIALFPPVSGG